MSEQRVCRERARSKRTATVSECNSTGVVGVRSQILNVLSTDTVISKPGTLGLRSIDEMALACASSTITG